MSLALAACGKDDNTHPVPLYEYVRAYPELPRELTANHTWSWANGRALGLVPVNVAGDGPRQTPALAGRLEGTAPFSWNGTGDGLQANMQATVARMGGGGLPAEDLAVLERFLLVRFAPPANPFVQGGGLTPQQAWGRELFMSPEVGCAGCHRPEQHFNDGLAHDVGTAGQLDLDRVEIERSSGIDPRPAGLFNTPTLEGLYHTAPCLHDGSAPTLGDVLERTGETMGKTWHLTPEQREALIAYLHTL